MKTVYVQNNLKSVKLFLDMNWPSFTLHKVYSSDRQTPDSAATATALLCGVKTNSQLIGVDDSAVVGNCSSQFGAEINCMNDWFEEQGTY